MHSKSAPRRRHDAQIKAKVLAACDEPGASVAAVALAHGLNANLVRKWRQGRGLKRAAITTSSSAQARTSAMSSAPASALVAALVAALAPARSAAWPARLAADARFLPIEISRRAALAEAAPSGLADTTRAASDLAAIEIELQRGAGSLAVRWPVSAAGDCAAWLREVAARLVK